MTESESESVSQREHRLLMHASFHPVSCSECWPDGAPVLLPLPPTPEACAPAARASGLRRADFSGLRARLAERGVEPDPVYEPPQTALDCQTCKGARVLHRDVPLGHPDFARLIACQDCRPKVIQQRLEKLWGSLPLEFRDWTLESYLEYTSTHFPEYRDRHHTLVAHLHSWLQTNYWLYLYSGGEAGSPGGAGRGKTGLAIALLKLLICESSTGIFVSAADLLQRLRDHYADREAYVESGRKDDYGLRTTDVLVLDEIGAERSNDWSVRDVLGPLIAHRHANGLRTILTSNLDLEGLSEHLGHTRLPSRIRERTDGGMWMLDLSELPDLRAVRKLAF